MPYVGRILIRTVVVVAALGVPLMPSTADSQATLKVGGSIAYVFSKNLQSGTGELLAFDTQTGAVVNRMEETYGVQLPELLVNPDGSSLYVLEGRVLKGGKVLMNTLSLIDTRSWKVVATTEVPQRMQYIVVGPGTMILSPDGSRLFVYSYQVTGPQQARYWLSIYQPVSLMLQQKRIPLPGCGVAYFAAVPGQIIAECFDSNDVRFISIRRMKVVATVHLPSWARLGGVGLFVSHDQGTAYVLTIDLRIIALSTTKHRIVQKITAFRQATQSIPSLYGAAVSGGQLIVGSMARWKDPESPFSLRPFFLPSFKPLKPVPLPRYTHFAAAPGGGVLTFPMGDSSDRDWRIQLLSPDLSQTKPLLQLNGPVFQLAVPSAALDGRLSGGLP
ncbi:MAG TPA: hypothetical protein VF221_09765 [Chloroflexota bacterium]